MLRGGKFASLPVRSGARRWLERPGVARGHRRALERLKRLYTEQDYFALVVTAECGGYAMQASLLGRHQADVTAAGAAEQVRALADGDVSQAGVWLPEQVLSERRFFAGLAEHGWSPSWESAAKVADASTTASAAHSSSRRAHADPREPRAS